MEHYRADLHIHSRYSRATSKALNTRQLAAWARVKGIEVLGTGDFTHAAWRKELSDTLVRDERTGLYKLKDDSHLEREIPGLGGAPLRARTLFAPQAEISSIYKRGGAVRKIHNLVFMPTLEAAERFSQRLAKVGNLESDGRPILGLDARNLLEIVLETDPMGFLVPAHIWTPWFSLFGSKSGFDTIEECFGDLSQHIFALETGLSSDPAMNWLWSALDRYRLISNSDAHSAEKLGREANRFSGGPSYQGMYNALRGEGLGHKFLGTVEFFPEEGKYYLDGHRNCNVVLEPHESKARNAICPVCGKPLTLGVLHRVLELCDREIADQPAGQPGFTSLIPLGELIAEVLGVAPTSKKVKEFYYRCIARFGPELDILETAEVDEVKKVSPLLAEGLSRMRRGEVIREPGFDGQFGVIRVFTAHERREFHKGRSLLAPTTDAPDTTKRRLRAKSDSTTADEPDFIFSDAASGPTSEKSSGQAADAAFAQPLPALQRPKAPALNPQQRHAAEAGAAPVLVVAGPGTGKTHTLTERIASLLEKGENPRRILALTFTRRAARELEERLVARFGENSALPRADTLHALAFEYWTQAYAEAPVILAEEPATRVFREANHDAPEHKLKAAWRRICLNRERRLPHDQDHKYYHPYVKLKESWNLADFTDLLEFWLEQIQMDIYLCPYTQILLDEVQDLSALQLAVVEALLKRQSDAAGQGLFAIGDPFQSIYGFRGATSDVQAALKQTWPQLEVVTLQDNYRSGQSILDLANTIFADVPETEPKPQKLHAVSDTPGRIRLFEAPTDMSEASWIADRIRWLVGGTSHSLADQAAELHGREDDALRAALSPADIAVLVRFKALIGPIRRTLDRLGLPCSVPEAEAFWVEPRAVAILAAAGLFLGIARMPDVREIACPDKILAKGPQAVAAYLDESPPFDRIFWQSPAFRDLIKAYEEHGGWAGLLNWIHLQSLAELAGQRCEKIRIMTMHAAKGLEFRAVFLPALEDGILPFAGMNFLSGKPADEEEPDTDEERRLFYVGVTRAKELLYLSHAAKRHLYGREVRLKPSRFLDHLPLDTVKRSTLKAHSRRKEERLSLF